MYGPRLTLPGSTMIEAFRGSSVGVSCPRAPLIVWQRSHCTPFFAMSLTWKTPSGPSLTSPATVPMAVWHPAQSLSTAPLVSLTPIRHSAWKTGSTKALECIEPFHCL